MKILIISQYFWPENFSINELALLLFKKNHDVHVLTGKPNYPAGKIFDGYHAWGFKKETYEGVTIYRIPMIARGRGALNLAINYLVFIINGILFSPWVLRRNRYEVIFVYGLSPILQAIPALFLGWIKNVPVVLWVQDLWPESVSATGYIKNRFLLKLIEYIVRFIYRNVDLILVQSEAFIDPVLELSSNTPVKYHPNSVDTSFTKPALSPAPEIFGFEGHFSIVFAGNIGTAQSVEVIVETAYLLRDQKDIQFIIIGDGSRRKWMIDEAKRLGLNNLHLPGAFSVDVMPAVMQQASVLLVSLVDEEIFSKTIPNKIQAYMASGRPIIASINGEAARVVMSSNAGVSVPAENSTELARAILQLYKMSCSELERMGQNGKQYFQAHFEQHHLAKQLIDYFQFVKLKD